MKENNIEHHYLKLIKDILDNGVEKQDRTGTGTISVFGRQIRHDMKLGFPLLTTKKMYFKGIVTELLWFLRGDTNIKYLVDNDCHIWDGDCYANYLKKRTFINKDNVREPVTLQNGMTGERSRPFTQEEFINKIKTDDEFADKYGDLGPIYGAGWRRWPKYSVSEVTFKSGLYSAWRSEVDQISKVIDQLKTNPDDRGIVVSAWNVSDLDDMVLRPCHYSFQVYTRELSLEEKCEWLNKNYTMYELGEWTLEKLSDSDYLEEVEVEYNIPTRAISLMWNQRSVDTFLGLPFNIASYGLLLEIIAKEVNMVPDELIGNLGDVHLYLNHIEQAKEQLNREPFKSPTVQIKQHSMDEPSPLTKPRYWSPDDFIVENYQSHPAIKATLSN